MDAHIARCPEARAAGGRPTGASAALAARLEKDRMRMQGLEEGGGIASSMEGL